jgi:hypothetical protein
MTASKSNFYSRGSVAFNKGGDMSLKHLNNEELIASTERALEIARGAEVEVLRHFQEIEERGLWTDAGSIYKYIARRFNLTGDQIYPRLQAMRLMRSIPEVELKLESGQLSVTNALKAHQVFAAESKQRSVSLEERRDVIANLENLSTKEADKVLAEKFPNSKMLPEKIKPVAKNKNLIQFYVDDETLKEIEEQKAKFSHQMPSGKMGDLVKILIRIANRQPTPRASGRVTLKKHSRYIPAEVKREMEKSRHHGCSHVDAKSGEACGSKHFLQMDHIEEHSRGGSNDLENLRWLCGFHNRHRFETSRRAADDLPLPLEI